MTTTSTKAPAAKPSGGWFSPRFFVTRALALAVLFLVAHLAGLREYTAFLSGTPATAGVGMRLSAFYGLVYIALYLGFVVVAPILLMAAGILALGQKLLPLEKSSA
jgi:hypothetical protein